MLKVEALVEAMAGRVGEQLQRKIAELESSLRPRMVALEGSFQDVVVKQADHIRIVLPQWKEELIRLVSDGTAEASKMVEQGRVALTAELLEQQTKVLRAVAADADAKLNAQAQAISKRQDE